MADAGTSGDVLRALLGGLSAQGYEGLATHDAAKLSAYPISGTLDLLALAGAVENALRGTTSDEEEAKSPADLNAANDG